ncbi:MAG: hypothetical protein D6813_05700 [Calditrichaeota bacterium]|nr:MAG: hypothetical protein D6813_05700 [Calditrichota bacterium]
MLYTGFLNIFKERLPKTIVSFLILIAIFGFLRIQIARGQTQDTKPDLLRQTQEEADRKSEGCLTCHKGIEKMHTSRAVRLGCIDCHGGDPAARTIEKGHVKPKYPDKWKTSANPVRSYTLLNKESPEFIKFVNPGDLRVAGETCGPCHANEVLNVKKSMMTTSALLWGGAAYNNGIVSTKHYIFGESYSREGIQQLINTVPAPSKEELKKGVLPFLVPLPRWEITPVMNIFRTFERGGKISRINPSAIGIPNPFEEPGRPDMKLSDRGRGTQLRISSPVLNIHKTRLNDPHLSFLGTNDHPGDYRSSGCSACHVIYANDRSLIHSGPYAKYGNTGFSFTADTTINHKESGHPIKHEFTRAIPTSQCMVCHMHQPNAFVNTYLGFQMWDYETDGEWMYPKKQKYPSDKEAFELLNANPEEAVLRGKWGDYDFLVKVAELNPKLKRTQFADYHGHGWIFRAVFKKDRKGNLLDKDDKIIPWDSAHKFHGVLPVKIPGLKECDDPECKKAQKAVHLKDIHAERGMHCVDCHYKQDNHGNGKLYGEFHNALEIQCVDCHGTVTQRATLLTSGLAAPEGGTDLTELYTPFKKRRFVKRGKKIIQRSMLYESLEWEVPQVVDIIDPSSKNYNPKARKAKLMTVDGGEWSEDMDVSKLAHSFQKMECYSCHNSWITNCFGCHLPQQANWKKTMNHFEGEESRNWTSYNPQVLRDDALMLCINGITKGNKVATARSSSALVLSSRNANREQIYIQQPPISAPGYSSQAFNPHFPHTVRTKETRKCTDCHLSKNNDNNAWLAQTFLLGTNMVNFMGKYVYVATGKHGFEAIAVTETDEPQAVIGSYLHRLAYPDYYKKHLANGRKLKVSYHHGGDDIRSIQLRGEYVYTANGPDGFRVFDVANIDNKGFSERIVTAPVSPLGQDTHVKTRYATAVALPTNMPVDTRRVYRPENLEQPIHPLYSYAYITDRYEGLILVDVMNLVDGDPRNNFLKRDVTFNPDGILDGAVNLTVAGHYVYICCDAGLVIVSVDDPKNPKVVAQVPAPQIKNPKAVAVQFRYAFVCDEEGVKVIDITFPEKPRFVENNLIPLQECYDIYVARTYAYVAAGSEGLVIIDVENPERMFIEQKFTANGQINDARGVKIGSTDASVFAYVADGKNGLRVIQLTSPETVGYLGFSPKPYPVLIASKKTHGPALAISKGLDRDRAVDESGHQVSIFGRLGSRPFTLEEMQKFYLKNGKIYRVTDDGEVIYEN